MTAYPPPLTYYKAPPPTGKRPAAVTTIAVLGIIIGTLLVLLVGSGPGPLRGRSSYYGYDGDSGSTAPAAIGQSIGVLLVITFHVLMVVACCGLLALKPAARILASVCCFAWFVMGALMLFYILYMFSRHTRHSSSDSTAIAVVIVLTLGIYVVFPLLALLTLRRPNARAAFARDGRTPPASPILRAATILTLICAGFWLLQSLMQLSVAIGDKAARPSWEEQYRYVHVLPFNIGDAHTSLLVQLVAGLVLNGSFLLGAILLLCRQPSGRSLIVIAGIVQLILMVNFWQGGMGWDAYQRYGYGDSDVRRWSIYAEMLASHAHSILAPALLIAIFTWRLSGDAPLVPQMIRGQPAR